MSRSTTALAMIAAAETIVWAALFYFFPIMLLRWEADLGWDRGDVALAFTLALAVSALASPLFGRLIDLGLSRFTLPATAAVGGLALIFLASVQSQTVFYATWAIIGFCCAGCLYEPCFAFLTRVKGENARGAITMVTLVAGFASSISYPVADALAGAYGWRFAATVFAAAVLLIAVPLFTVSAHILQKDAIPQTVAPAQDHAAATAARRTLTFWLLATAFPLLAITHGMAISHIIPLMGDKGATHAQAVLAASLIGPMQVVGRIVMMTAGRRLSGADITLISFGGIALSMLIMLSAQSGDWRIFGFVTLLGACYGVQSITKPLVTADLLGLAGFGAISGALALPYIAAVAAAPFAAVLFWRWGGYDLMLVAGAVFTTAAVPCLWLARRSALRRA
ncbi:MAG: MFS transporter [Pseudomonadota bacterium]